MDKEVIAMSNIVILNNSSLIYLNQAHPYCQKLIFHTFKWRQNPNAEVCAGIEIKEQ